MVEKGSKIMYNAKMRDYALVLNVNTNLFPGYGSVNMHLYATLSIYPAICYISVTKFPFPSDFNP